MKLWSRRNLIAAGVVAAIGGTVLRATYPFRRHYRPTPYDDLIAQLDDREAGTRIGRAVLHQEPGFDIARTAARLRGRFQANNLAAAIGTDIGAGRVEQVGGWVLPQTLVMLCAVTADV